jgi:hypothetical protein
MILGIGSKSMSNTLFPFKDKEDERLMAVVALPHPPF